MSAPHSLANSLICAEVIIVSPFDAGRRLRRAGVRMSNHDETARAAL